MFQSPLLTTARRSFRLAPLAVVILFFNACSYLPSLQFPGVYKIDIQQGNIITQEMIDELRPGMTKRQVIFVMGTPLVRDPFNQDRWDYVYSYQPGGGTRGQESVSMYFENDLLTHFTGDFKPTEEAATTPATSTPPASS